VAWLIVLGSASVLAAGAVPFVVAVLRNGERAIS
jgi:hypothetical protein